jgi:hypothetical protein
MGRFLLKIFRFTAVLVVLMAVNAGLNTLIFGRLPPPLENADILIAGDSHPQKALDPARLSSARNISQPAEPYIVTYWKLKYLFRWHAPRVLLLGFSHHHLSAFNDRKFWDPEWSGEMFNRVYPIQEFGRLDALRVDRVEFFKIFLNRMCLYPRLDHFDFIGDFCAVPGTHLERVQVTLDRHFYHQGRELPLSETALHSLAAIVELCRDHGVAPVLVGSPVHPDYLGRIPAAIKGGFEAEKARWRARGIRVLDCTAAGWADEFYLDADHLNQRGAARFTDQVAQMLDGAASCDP